MIFLLKCMCCSQISSFLLLRQRERETKWKQNAGISQAANGLQIDIDNDRSDVQSRIGNKGISKTKSENIYRMRKKWRWWCFGCDDDKSAPTFARVINHAAGWNCRQLMSMILVKPAEQVKPSRSLSLSCLLSRSPAQRSSSQFYLHYDFIFRVQKPNINNSSSKKVCSFSQLMSTMNYCFCCLCSM